MSKHETPVFRKLEDAECRYYCEQLRAARYAALRDAEGFSDICFALEALGLRLRGQRGDLGKYKQFIESYALRSPVLYDLSMSRPAWFKTFNALYSTVQNARNDNMHAGAYARHATAAAIELCIGLEEALMIEVKRIVGSLMIKSPVTVEPWQPVAHARHLMLMHSFSFLPLWHEDRWWLLSEMSLAKFLNVDNKQKAILLGLTINDASKYQRILDLTPVDGIQLCTTSTSIDELLERANDAPTLWLVTDESRAGHLAGVLSPFELM